MKLAFAGTPEFARVALQRLHAAHRVVLVLTQPDRPAGRGMRLQPSAVKAFALEQGLALAQPRGLRLDGRYAADAAAARDALWAAEAELIVVAAYGLILPPWLLELPRHGCLNIHASLLPRWRGAAPIQRAIEAGDSTTGITIMRMDAGLDTGSTLLAATEPITAAETAATLHDKLAALGGHLVIDALQRLEDGRLRATPQPELGVTYAAKIDKAEAAVDWSASAAVLERRLRAFDPFPGVSTVLRGERLKLWRGRVGGASAARRADDPASVPGTLLDHDERGLHVACGEGVLIVTELQRPGGPRLAAREFMARHPVAPGSIFGLPHPIECR